MMKKIAALALALLFLLTACSQTGTTPAENSQDTDTPAEVTETATETATEAVTEAATEAETETAAAEPSDEGSVQIANPWRDVSEEEAKNHCPNSFNVPAGAENVVWSIMDPMDDAEDAPGKLVQVTFDLDGLSYTAREQVTGEESDISGLYYDWVAEDDMTLQNWRDGLMQGHCYRYIGDEGYVDLCTWYDVEIGITYSLSVASDDLDGFDLQAIAEAMA